MHLKLSGDFDGSSAQELIQTMKTQGRKEEKIFLHTNGLGEVHPFGRAVFQMRISEVKKTGIQDLIITGDKINL
jgi:hypothetical protein